MNFDIEKAAGSPWVAGLFGSLVGLRFIPGLTWAARAFNAAGGLGCAGFLTPVLAHWLRVDSPGVQSGLAFAVGMFGLSVAVAAVDGMRAVNWGAVIKGWVSRKG